MTARPLALIVAGFLALAVSAAPPPAAPETLPAAMSRQLEDVVALKKKTDEAIAALRNWYESALDILKKNALAKGDLDAVLAADTERERMDRDLTADEKSKLPPQSLQVRNQYDQARAAQGAQEKSAYLVLLRGYVTTLEGLEKRLTQQGDIDGAIATRKERAAAAQQLSNGTLLPGDLLAAQPPKPGATPAPPLPVAGTPVPPPTGRTPPEPAPIGMPLGAAIEVASEMKPRSEVQDVAKEAMVFEGPGGNGRRYSKGVLLKNDSLTGKNGSTWALKYTRGGGAQGLQIIHPHGSGQMICHLHRDAVGISTPALWTESGYGKGDVSRIVKKKAFEEFFPLKDAEEYQVVSKLDGQGAYELTINGKIVATARVNKTSPLSLEMNPGVKSPGVQIWGTPHFTGNDFPLEWAAGYAAVLLGPMEAGEQNLCREVRFWPAVGK
jgi:hypothetical protein